MFIKGSHIGLRALEPNDADILYDWENNINLWPVSNSQVPFSHFILEEFVNASHQDIYTNKQLRLMVSQLSDQKTIGVIDLYEFDPQHARAGIGIFIHHDYRGNGYAKQSIELIKQYAFDLLHLKQIYTHVNVSNEASLALFEATGFEKSGLKKYWHKSGLNTYDDVWFLQCYNAN